ncbi:MAG: hypothetical protein IJC48_11680 [Clostridia bacterium]|nr:hypothetical protein [Clostridia bacterium]
MKLIKCPRCELNYIYENEKICSVCKRDVRGEVEQDDVLELCSECGEHPVMPGQEVCVYCLKELQRRSAVVVNDDSSPMTTEEPNLNIDPSAMDEINIDLPDDVDAPFDADDEDFDDDADFDDEEDEE